MNCKKGEIIEYEVNEKMVLYSFRLADQAFCEFDRFISRFDLPGATGNAAEQKEDLYIILAAVDEIVKRGAREGRFRGENNVHALPAETCGLRLYCIRLHSGAVLLGNGGIKTSQKLKDSPDCFPHYQLLSELEKEITKRIQTKEISWGGPFLNGDLYFELGDCDQ